MEAILIVCDSPRTFWAASGIIYAINCVLVCMRPRMAMDFGFTKWYRGWTSGLPMTAHCWILGLLKTVPGLCEVDKNRPCVVCLN